MAGPGVISPFVDDDARSPALRNGARQVEPLIYGAARVVRRRKLLVAAVFVAFVLPAAVFVKLRPLVYEATARLLIERSGDMAGMLRETHEGEPQTDDAFHTQAQLLRSRPLIARTVQQLRLWESPQFAIPVRITGSLEEISRVGLVDRFLRQLTIAPTPGTHLLNVTFEAADPQIAMRAANTLTAVYIKDQTDAQSTESSNVVTWLNERLEEQRRQLERSERAVQAYVESHDAISVQDRQNIVVQKLSDLNTALTRAKTDRMAKEALYQQLSSAEGRPDAVDSLAIVLSNSVLQQLRTQLADLRQKETAMSHELGDRNPDMVKLRSEIALTSTRLNGEIAKLTESVKNDFLAAQAIERDLVQALDAQKRDVLDLNRKSLEYGELQRQAKSDREIFEKLLSEAQTRGVAGKIAETRIRVVEPAELPLAPTGPQNTRDLALVIGAGILLGLGAPLFVESLDRRLKTPTEVEERLQVPCIAMVPTVYGGGRDLLTTVDHTPYNEAFRRLRAAIATKHRGRVMITSAAPQEGKSLVSANLAIALARLDHPVLLVDGDLRRPVLHEMFGLGTSPGFSDVLNDTIDVERAVQATTVPNLSILTCGALDVHAAELLASPRLEEVLKALDRSFAWIVFDSPPVGPVADACVIGRYTGHTLVVVAADSTTAGAAVAAVERLKAAEISVAGAILNRVDLAHSAYYYGPYSYGAYTSHAPKPAARVN